MIHHKLTPAKRKSLTIDEVLERLENVSENGDGWKAQCPLHESKSGQNLAVTVGDDGTVLLHCHARGCDFSDIMKALSKGLVSRDRVYQGPVFEYFDRAGNLVAVHRHKGAWYMPVSGGMFVPAESARRPIYNLRKVLHGILDGKMIYVCEGEKDVHTLDQMGLIATTSGGADTWRPEYARELTDAKVVIVGDNDEAGREYLAAVGSSLEGVAREVRVLDLPRLEHKEDVTDWVEKRGGTLDEYLKLSENSAHFSDHALYKGSEHDQKEFLPVLSARELYATAREETPWVVEGLAARGAITDFHGAAKESGKTTFILDLVSHVTAGLVFVGKSVAHTKALILSEMSQDNLKGYLRRAGIAEGDDVSIVLKRDVWEVPWADLIPKAGELCAAEGRGILIIDTFAEFSGIRGTEENNAGDIQEKMSVVRRVAQTHDIAVMVIRHSGKSGKGRGSSAFEGVVDIVVDYKRPDGHDSTSPTRVIDSMGRWDASNFRTNVERTEDGFEDRGSSGRIKHQRAALEILNNTPTDPEAAISRTELEKRIPGVAKETIKRVLKDLIDKESIFEVGAGKKGDPLRYYKPTLKKSEKKLSDHAPRVGGEQNDQKEKVSFCRENAGYNGSNNGISHENPKGILKGAVLQVKRPYVYVTEDLSPVLDELAVADEVGLDTETTGDDALDVRTARVRLIQLRTEGGVPYVIDAQCVDPAPVLAALRDKTLILHNAAFDLAMLRNNYGYVHEGPVFDTQIAGQVIWAGMPNLSNKYEGQVERLLGESVNKSEQVSDWGAEKLTDSQLSYAATDVLYLHELAEFLREKGRDLSRVLDLENRMVKVVAEMSALGMPVDEAEFVACVKESEDGVAENLAKLDALVTEPLPDRFLKSNRKRAGREDKVNWDSPNQVKWALESAGLKLESTNKQVLAEYEEHPMVATLLAMRKVGDVAKRFRNTKVEAGRAHATWKQVEADTGRMACQKPPLQGVPKPLKRAFAAPEGHKLIVSDLSQIEVRVLAALSGDENLRQEFLSGQDVHRAVAANVLGIPRAEVTSDQRKLAKALVFGLLYGQGLKGFADKAREVFRKEYSLKEVERKFWKPFFESYPGVAVWRDRMTKRFESGRTDSYTALGRRRLQLDRGTQALNTPIQGGAADVMKAIAVGVYERKAEVPGLEIVGLVHDEILATVPEKHAEDAARLIDEVMRKTGGAIVNIGVPEGREVPVEAETKACNTWAEKE